MEVTMPADNTYRRVFEKVRIAREGSQSPKTFRLLSKSGEEVYRLTKPTEKYRLELDCDFVLTVDVDAIIRRLGQKAAFSKSKRSRDLGGLVEVKLLEKRQVSCTTEKIPIDPNYQEVTS
jgi:hypothetical protein